MKVGKIVLFLLAVLLGSNAGLAAVEIDGLTYIVDESGRSATLIKCGLEGDVHIPNCININDEAYEVKCIGEGFENASPLFVNATSVFIPSSVLQIRRRVFSRCSKLQSITFEDGDQPLYISGKEDDSGTGAFYLCTSLKYIYLGRSFSKVNLFYQTNIGGPIKLEISPNLKNIRGFSGAPLDPDVDLSNIEVIGDEAFSSTPLSDIKLPNIKRIGVAAFLGCNLVNVQFGSMLEKIGDLAFCGTKIQTLTLPKSLQEVGIRAFDEIKSLKSITIEDSDEPLYIRPYEGVEMFKEARIEELHVGRNIDLYYLNEYCGPFGINVSKINNYLPMELTFGKNVTRINHSMFANRAIKGDLLLPDSIEIIMDYGFAHGKVRNGNNKIKCLKLPKNLKSCGLMPFGLQYAEKVIVPEGITFLSSKLFPFSVGKKGSIEIPSSVEVIESHSNFIGDTIIIADRQTPLNIMNVDFEGEYIYCGMPLESSYGWDDNVIKCQTFEIGKESKRCEVELNLSGENPMIISNPLKPPYINNIDKATYKNAKVVIEFDSFKDYKASQVWSKFENYDYFITLSNRSISLKLDESIEIQGSINPICSNDNILTWTSSNEEVAIINDGVVYAKTIGTCNIIAKDRLGHIATCQITVNPVQVESNSLNPKEWSGVISGSFQIISTVFPDNANNKTLEWSSSDENVAVVDESGTVTAVGVGKCVITAAATDGSGVTATCEITVNPVLVESMTLTPAEWNGIEGETFQITATVLPENATDKTLEWSSSDENVAVVDESGTVTAVGVGKCVITAAATDGSGVTATCEITVNPVLVESMTLTPAEWNGIEGETFQITATVLPENATYKTLEWSSSNELVATVDNSGLVSVLKEGSCIITAKTTDGSEISAECIVTSTSGIDDIFSDADERFDIYNMQGLVIKKDCNRDGLKMLSSGIYILRQGRETRKIIIR